MPPKRKAGTTQKKAAGGGPAKRRKMTKPAMVNLAKKIVASQLNKQVETKQSVHTVATGNLYNNKIEIVDTNLFATTQGVTDPNSTDSANRIGDEINVRGLSIRFMIELALNQSDVTYRAMVIKGAKGDTPTLSTLFNGINPCKLLDRINTERYSVLYSKTFKLVARNMTLPYRDTSFNNQTQGATSVSTGVGYTEFANSSTSISQYQAQGKATRLMDLWIPGRKLFRNGVCRYENGSTQVKFFNHYFIVYSWSNSDANIDPAQNVVNGLLKHYVCQLYFKDA